MRDPIWKGALELGAVRVPLALYPATASESGERVPLKALHRGCQAPLKQVMRCSECGDETHGDFDKVSAYEYSKGRFAVVDKKALPRAESDERGVLQVEDFVPMAQLDIWAFDRHYWVAPAGSASSFALIHRALAQKGAAAIVRVVLRSKQRLAVLYPRGQYLCLTTLYYSTELRPADELPPGADGVAVRELDFEGMLHVIDAHSNIYRPERYRDTYGEATRIAVADAVEAAVMRDPATATEPPGTVTAIIQALRAPEKVR